MATSQMHEQMVLKRCILEFAPGNYEYGGGNEKRIHGMMNEVGQRIGAGAGVVGKRM